MRGAALAAAALLGVSVLAQSPEWQRKSWVDPMNDVPGYAVYRYATAPVQCAYNRTVPYLSVEWPSGGRPVIGIRLACVMVDRGAGVVYVRLDELPSQTIEGRVSGDKGDLLILSGLAVEDLLAHRRLRVDLPLYGARAVAEFNLEGLEAALQPEAEHGPAPAPPG